MKKFKTALYVLLVATLVFTLSSCKSADPSAQVEKDIDTLKDAELSTKLLESGVIDIGDEAKESSRLFFDKIMDFDYEIVDEKLSDDETEADVVIEISSYDFGTKYLDVWGDISEGKLTASDEDELYKVFFDEMSKLEDKTLKTKITVHCKKSDDGEWQTDLLSNSDFQEALLGGLMDIVTELANL